MSATANRRARRATARDTAQELTGAEIERLAERAVGSGCARCGIRFASLVPCHFVRTVSDAWAVRCGECLAGTTPCLVGFWGGASDPWVDADRTWFEQHPTRRWRLRPPMRGELETIAADDGPHRVDNAAGIVRTRGCGWAIAVVVEQIEPGKRTRSLAAVRLNDSMSSFTDAGILRMIPALADAPPPDVEALLREREAKLFARLDRTVAEIKGRQS
jgi:hypothetical protein